MSNVLNTSEAVALSASAFAVGILSSFVLQKYGLWPFATSSTALDSKQDRSSSRESASSSFDSEEDDGDARHENYKMVMIVRTDLKMGKGKIAAQCCHAAVGAYRRAPKDDVQRWYRSGCAKIALKCSSQEELETLAAMAQSLNLTHYVVCDAGRTQIAAGSLTVCAIGPAPISRVDEIAGHLKLM